MRSYGGAFGKVDAMRIGPDNGPGWGSLKRGPTFGTWNYHLDGRIWYNDPDPVYVRNSMPIAEAKLICSWVTVAGALSVSSDAYKPLDPERLYILQRTMPSHTLEARPVDLFDTNLARIWQATDDSRSPRLDIIGLYNWNDKDDDAFDIPLARLGLDAAKTYAGFDYWANEMVPAFKGTLARKLPARTCQVLAIREVVDHPIVLSTSRHIMQGVVDLSGEKWDAASKTLSGTSKVVAGDPYELRVLTATTGGAFKAAKAEVSEDAAAGMKVSMKADGDLVRVTIQSGKSCDVNWKVSFGSR